MIAISAERASGRENPERAPYRIELGNDTQVYARNRAECMIAVDHYFGGNGHTKHDHPQCPICRSLSVRDNDGRWDGWTSAPNVQITCPVKFVTEREIAPK